VPLSEIWIDDDTWSLASEPRRAEWTALMRDLEAHAELGAANGAAARLRVTRTDDATLLVLETDDGAAVPATELARAEVTRDALSRYVAEYVDVCRKLASDDFGYGSPRFEALDMGKKLLHDDAADVLVGQCAPLRIDHDTARRLFSLLVALRVDTTRMVGVHRHRPIR